MEWTEAAATDHAAGMEIISIIIAAVVAILVGRALFGVFFHDSDDFWDCVKFSFVPDLFSLFRGQLLEDMAKSFKLSIYLFCMFGSGLLAFAGVQLIGEQILGFFAS